MLFCVISLDKCFFLCYDNTREPVRILFCRRPCSTLRVCANPFRHNRSLHFAGVCEPISPQPLVTLRGCGEIGIRIRFRILRREACRFDPCHPHQNQKGHPERGVPFGFGVGAEPNPHASKAKEIALGKNAWGKERGLRGAVRRCRKRSFHSRLGERDDPCHPRFLRVTEREGALVAPSLFGVGTEPNPHASLNNENSTWQKSVGEGARSAGSSAAVPQAVLPLSPRREERPLKS